jgi:predicted ATPase
MVAELAPLDLWVRDFLSPGDLLVVDEPEAHLHPENQRRIATALVRLAKAGVVVVCPTHSSTILHQISNHLLANELSAEDRRNLGLSEDDLISPEEVGVYLFKQQRTGSHIRTVRIETGFGIAEDEFVRVAEEIGEESFRLTTALAIDEG